MYDKVPTKPDKNYYEPGLMSMSPIRPKPVVLNPIKTTMSQA